LTNKKVWARRSPLRAQRAFMSFVWVGGSTLLNLEEQAMDPMLDALRSRAEIAEVVMAYCRGFDRCDRALLERCFHPDATHEHGSFKGPSSDFVTMGLELVSKVALTHHQLGQISIELDGDVAWVESYFTSYHRLIPAEDRIMAGRYVDRFERRGGTWRIAHRRGVNEWLRHEPASDRGFFDRPAEERGRRDRQDPVYRRA
jgi:hypothetical protein